ncbi:MAG: hypothetical protein RL226_1769 [Bacteroidota bacterium]
MSRNKKILTITVSVLVILISLAVIFGGGGKNTQVTVETVQRHTIIEKVSASGKIQPEVDVKISAEVSGLIVDLPVKEGDRVEKGQLLVGINPDIYNAALNRAMAALNTAQSNLASSRARKAQAEAQFLNAEQSFNRSKQLFEKGAISQAEFDQAVATFEVAKADVTAAVESIRSAEFSIKSADASRAEAQDNLRRTNLVAPQSGTVTALTKEEGEAVLGTSMMQGETIMKISDLSSMEVNVEVNESDIVRISLGDTADVEVDAYVDQKFKGIVTEISNTALNALETSALSMNQVTNFSVKVRILPESYAHLTAGKPDNYSPFRPGMSATVDIITETASNVIAVPIKAVTTRSDTTSNAWSKFTKNEDTTDEFSEQEELVCAFVFENGKAKIRVLETGIQDNKYIQVLSGINEGETIITGPYDEVDRKLKSGKTVEISTKEKDEDEESEEDV